MTNKHKASLTPEEFNTLFMTTENLGNLCDDVAKCKAVVWAFATSLDYMRDSNDEPGDDQTYSNIIKVIFDYSDASDKNLCGIYEKFSVLLQKKREEIYGGEYCE